MTKPPWLEGIDLPKCEPLALAKAEAEHYYGLWRDEVAAREKLEIKATGLEQDNAELRQRALDDDRTIHDVIDESRP